MPHSEVRYAKPEDLRRFYGVRPRSNIRAIAVEADGEIIGVGGVEYRGGRHIAFMDVADDVETKDYLRELAVARKMARHVLDRLSVPVLAVRETGIPGSDKFLAKSGFVLLAENEHQEVWTWVQLH